MEPLSIPKYPDSEAAFVLSQPWRTEPEPGFLPATVHLSWVPTALLIRAAMDDAHVFTHATADNQRMWELGDVFEIFLMLEGRHDYAELHVTPQNHRMHLHLPGPEGRPPANLKPLPFETMLQPVSFSSEARATPTGWAIAARVPAHALNRKTFRKGDRLRVSFGRYDATPGKSPILSTTAAHLTRAFHRPQDWTPIRLA